MAYLYQLSQSLNGMTPEQIKAMQASLAPEDQKALAQGLAIVSNPNAKSGNANTEGVTDATRDTFVPAAGSLINLPDGMYNELSRGDRIVQEPPSFDNMGNPMPGSTRLNGVGALQDVSDIFKPAAGEYLNGSEASKSMLDAVSHYAAADVAQREATARSGVFSPAPFFSMDAHGSDLQGSLAGVLQVAANDHVSMHDLSTNPASGGDFLKGLTAENWGSHSAQIGDAFRWMDDDPHNPINSETASATAHYLSDNEQKHLQHMPGTSGQTFGTVNPELLRAMAEGVIPYLPQLAGADGEGGFNASGVESFKSQDQMASMFS